MAEDTSKTPAGSNADAESEKSPRPEPAPQENAGAKEIGGRGGLDPTRYGDWEKAGRCVDF
jgi:hypothetical protein